MSRERARAAVLGAVVADAATTGLHWIYKLEDLNNLLQTHGRTSNPEFFDPPSGPFYKTEVGDESAYGAELIPLINSIAAQGGVDGAHLTQTFYDFFSTYPSYKNHPSRELVENVKAGKKWPHVAGPDDQANCLVKVPVLVARYGGTTELTKKLEEAVRAHQNDDRAVARALATARILERVVIDGASVRDAVKWAIEAGRVDAESAGFIQEVLAAADVDHVAAVRKFGPSCHLPDSFKSPLHNVYTLPSYVEGVRQNIVAGGDNASRAAVVGAFFAAEQGLDAVPPEWRARTKRYTELQPGVDAIVNSNTVLN